MSTAAADPAHSEESRNADELRLLRFLWDLGTHLRDTRDADAALRFMVRAVHDYFQPHATCVANRAVGGRVEISFNLPSSTVWDSRLFATVLAGEKPAPQPELMFARLRRRDRPWGLLALSRRTGVFDRADRQALVRIANVVSAILRDIDTARTREVRDRIDRKIMSEIQPVDLAYQILDALRSLTRYDHSSALFLADASDGLELFAEQIAHHKTKSSRIGTRLTLPPQAQKFLLDWDVALFERQAAGWVSRQGCPAELASLFCSPAVAGAVPEAELLLAPLRGKEGLVGVLKIGSLHPGTFGDHEAEQVSAFVPQAVIALQNSQRAARLHERMIAAERKHVLAELARGVAHDLNNALGQVLPLIQQMRAEVAEGKVDPATVETDLTQIEQAMGVCRRIFANMLSFARRSPGAVGGASLAQAVSGTLAILEEGMKHRGIRVSCHLPEALPGLPCSQNDLEQVVLNLITNARDAMPSGGAVSIRAWTEAGAVGFSVADNGCGIPPDHLPRLGEPFFTTKPNGTGLGVAICRSIVWDMGGQIEFQSAPGRGTTVVLSLPVEQVNA